jgi:capsular polysaccharide biosynthesis protein
MKKLLRKIRSGLHLIKTKYGKGHTMAQPPQSSLHLFPGIGKHHNILDVGNFLSSVSSAQFAIEHFTNARPFPEKNYLYSWAMQQAKSDGLVLEFGVASGGTVNQLATHHKGPVHGFDVFTGLPETWRPGFPKGAFAQENLPKVKDNVELVVGLFDDTLPDFVAAHPGRVKLLHVDCDIYSGTVTIFRELADQIDDDTIIIFDEYLNFPGWETCEHKAFLEFCEDTGRTPEYLAFVPASEQVVARALKQKDTLTSITATPKPAATRPATGALTHVQHATFAQLASAGYDVTTVDEDAPDFKATNHTKRPLPQNWKNPQATITPKVATLAQAKLFHDGSVLLPDGLYSYYDATFNIEPWRTRHNRSVLRYIDEHHDDALIQQHKKSMLIEGRCFSALSNTTHNYGHFIHDVLSRIYYEDLGLIAPGREKIIAPHFKFPMQRYLFETIFSEYEIIEAPAGTVLEVEELVLPANLCSSLQFNANGITALASRMRTAFASYAGSTPRKVCVSRKDGKDTGGRAFTNVDAYERMMKKEGYEVVEVSRLDIETQLALWTNTTDIVGIHGAGMMNMIMMPQGTRYTEITGATRGPFYTARCAISAGHNVAGTTGPLDEKGNAVIDLDALKKVLK